RPGGGGARARRVWGVFPATTRRGRSDALADGRGPAPARARAAEARGAAHPRRERALGAAERGRQAHGLLAPAGGPTRLSPAPRGRARLAEPEPRAGAAERLRPTGADAGACGTAAPIGNDHTRGGSLPRGRREAPGEGARRRPADPLRPHHDVPRPPAPGGGAAPRR